MAIAYVAGSTPQQLGGIDSPLAVNLPAGHLSGHLLMLFLLSDDKVGTTATPTGWTKLTEQVPAGSGSFLARARTEIFYRIDTGSLGSTVSVSFSKSTWPDGDASVLAWTAAYSGCDTTGPIERWDAFTDQGVTATQSHPPETTLANGDWLMTVRTAYSATNRTFTVTPGTDTERVDTRFDMMHLALYDTNAGLAPGAQTVRLTDASGTCSGGSVMLSIVLKPAAAASAVFASADTATALGTALDATVQDTSGTWELCADDGLPTYRFEVDWSGDGTFGEDTGTAETLAADTFSRTATDTWGSAETGGLWNTSGGSATDFDVTGGRGLHNHSSLGVYRFSTLPVTEADTDIRVTISLPSLPVGASSNFYLMARYLDADNFYFARCLIPASGAAALSLRKRTTSGGEVALVDLPSAFTYTAGTSLILRLRTFGNQLRAKLWEATSTEPEWQATASDGSLTAAGSVGLRSHLGVGASNPLPFAYRFDDFLAYRADDLEDVTDKIISDVSITYGRDQDRQLSLASVGSAAFKLINVDRYLSPDFASSPLFGDTEPARRVRGEVSYGSTDYALFSGRIDDYDIKADFTDRSASFTLLDGLSILQGQTLSTGVYKSMRTGELIGVILDLVGWTGGRDLDLGATIVPYWWVEDVDAFQAINDLVRSEGPPALAYQAPDGTFVFRDRHHRLLRQESAFVQATFAGPLLGECDAPAVEGLKFTPPFTYAHGWRDIVNSVTFEVAERGQSASLEPVWTSDDQLPIAIGQSVVLEVSTSEPFTDAVAPVQGTDYDLTGSGVLNVSLSRTSGQSVVLTLLAVGGSVSVSNLQLRAKPIFTRRNIKVSREDADSITRHGKKSYPESAPWANANDADAIAGMILLHYAQRRPTVQLRISSADPQHFIQVVRRAVSDRIHIRYDEMGLDDDFFVEHVTHSIVRFNQEGRPPVHSVTLGCERNVVGAVNPFTFDLRGAGFDEGVFDPIQMDQPDTVFRFDDDVQGRFDIGLYGT